MYDNELDALQIADADEACAIIENPDRSREDRAAAEAALRAMEEGWTAEELAAEDALAESRADNLRVEDVDGGNRRRIWLSRTGVSSGEPFENTVTIEHEIGGEWLTTVKYDGGELADDDQDEDEGDFSGDESVTVNIELGNAAMNTADAIAAELRETAARIEEGKLRGPIIDGNGNTVGRFEIGKATTQEVYTVEVHERTGLYVFAELDDRDRFADAVRKAKDNNPERDHEDAVFCDAVPVNDTAATTELIKAEQE